MHVINDISEIGLRIINRKWNPAHHLHKNEMLILFVRKGHGNVEMGESYISLYKADLLIVTSHDKKMGLNIMPVKDMELFIITFSTISVYKFKNEWKVSEIEPQHALAVHQRKINHPLIRYHQEELYKIWKENKYQVKNNIPLEKHFKQLLLEIDKISDLEMEKQESELDEITSYIEHHFNEEIQVNDLVQSSGLNLTTFYKLFKDYTGYPPLQYITNKRVEKAKQLLLTTSMQISDIANKVGYQDVYYFSRIFKRTVGISPLNFSKLCKRKFFVIPPAFAVNLLALGISKGLLYPLSQSDIEDFLMNSKKNVLNPEEVSLQEPDCIICGQKNIMFHRLEKIAPTLLVSYKHMSWREQLLQLAKEIEV